MRNEDLTFVPHFYFKGYLALKEEHSVPDAHSLMLMEEAWHLPLLL